MTASTERKANSWSAQPTKVFIPSEIGQDLKDFSQQIYTQSSDLLDILIKTKPLSSDEANKELVANHYLDFCLKLDSLISKLLKLIEIYVEAMEKSSGKRISDGVFRSIGIYQQGQIMASGFTHYANQLKTAFQDGYHWGPKQDVAEKNLNTKITSLGLKYHRVHDLPKEFSQFPNEKAIAKVLVAITDVLAKHVDYLHQMRNVLCDQIVPLDLPPGVLLSDSSPQPNPEPEAVKSKISEAISYVFNCCRR